MTMVLGYGGNMAHAQHAALAFDEVGALLAYVTTFHFEQSGPAARLLRALPLKKAKAAYSQLGRRSITLVDPSKIHAYPLWEIARSLAVKLGASPITVDKVWDHMSLALDTLIARRYVPQARAVQLFEYTALASFVQAKQHGVARVLHLASLDSKEFEEIQEREKTQWPFLRGEHDSYFRKVFWRRYERRREEIALADVIIANSSLTARSHIAAGADPSRVFVCPLGAPPPIAKVRTDPSPANQPLRAIYAGPFSIGKGAHYLLEAWRRIGSISGARLDIYGQNLLPPGALRNLPQNITFHGSVPQQQLFAAYEVADVLVFPTLSDGYGMVAAEALAHGLPVVISRMAGCADLITEETGRIVEAANPQSLVEALRWCLDNRRALADMRPFALEVARNRQWTHFRSDLRAAFTTGLQARGYHVSMTNSAHDG